MLDRIIYCFLGVFAILLILVFVVTFDGSKDNQETTQEVTSFYDSNFQSGDDVYVYVDPDTGVNYLIFYGYRKGGITPRLNSDGSIMIEKEGAADENK